MHTKICETVQKSKEEPCYRNWVPQCLHIRLLISLPRYFLHEGHLQLRALKPIKAAISRICAAKIVSFENSPIRSGCLWSKTRNKRRTSVAAIARSWRLLHNPKSRIICLLSLSCIIRIFLLPENDNIYSNIIPLWL